MSEIPSEAPTLQQGDFEKITQMVSAEFQIEEAFMEHNIPTYYLKQPQKTKQAFLRLLRNLESVNLIAVLQKTDGRIVLKILPKPSTKPSNVLVNWLLFLATIGTTFLTGYIISRGLGDPLIGGLTFTIAIMAVLGAHEMGHKLAANRNRIEATPPYFIPGPPPLGNYLMIGTFGAVIMQKSLPPNKDSLFDMGVSGPLVGFFVSIIVTFIGLALSPSIYRLPEGPFMSLPLLFQLVAISLHYLGVFKPGNIILLHPVAFAGIIGMIVTMLQLLPAGMLDGGHVAKSIFGEKVRGFLAILSIVFLILNQNYPMAFFVLFLSFFRHPGALDDVTSLSTARKCIVPVLLVIFILCGIMISEPVYQIRISSNVSNIPFNIYYADSKYYSDTTVWETLLAEGSYAVCFPLSCKINEMTYTFLQWENGFKNPNRTIVLNQDVSLTAYYAESIQ